MSILGEEQYVGVEFLNRHIESHRNSTEANIQKQLHNRGPKHSLNLEMLVVLRKRPKLQPS